MIRSFNIPEYGHQLSAEDMQRAMAEVEHLANITTTSPLKCHISDAGYSFYIDFNDITISNLTVNNFFTLVDNSYFYDFSIHITNNYYLDVTTIPFRVVTNVCAVNKTVSKVATGTTTINSTSETDITGSSSTFSLTGTAVCMFTAKIEWDGNGAATTGETFAAYVNVDTTTNTTTFAKTYVVHASQIIDGCITLSLGSLAAGSHTVKLVAKRLTGAGSIVVGVNTSWTLHAETLTNVEARVIYIPAAQQYGPTSCTVAPSCCDTGDPPDPPDPPVGDCEQQCSAYFEEGVPTPVCSDQPTAWDVTISGISGYSGNNPNGTYSLTPVSPCMYEGAIGSGARIRISIVYWAGVVRYFLTSVGPIDYFLFQSDQDYDLGENCCHEVTFIPSGTQQLTVPDEITATPDDCCDGEVTACCEGVGIPNTLTATITAKVGDCSCLSDTYTMENTSPGVWTSTANLCASGFPLTLTCTGTSIDDWEISSASFGTDGPDTGSTCSPLSLIWAGETPAGVCTGTCTVTITE